MNGEDNFDAVNASGSTDINFSSKMFQHEEIKQENFDGWYINIMY